MADNTRPHPMALCKEIKWLMAIAAALALPALYGLVILADMRADIRWLKQTLAPLAPIVAKVRALPVVPVDEPPITDAGVPDTDWRLMQRDRNLPN